jgi:hypothetical protein
MANMDEEQAIRAKKAEPQTSREREIIGNQTP